MTETQYKLLRDWFIRNASDEISSLINDFIKNNINTITEQQLKIIEDFKSFALISLELKQISENLKIEIKETENDKS